MRILRPATTIGTGYSLLSPRSVELELETGRLHLLDLEGYSLKRMITIIREKNRYITLACQKLIDIIQNAKGTS